MGDMPELGGKVSLDVTDWKTGIAELNRATRVIESGFRAAAAGMDDWAKSADGLEMRIASLTDEMVLQEKKVELLRKEYERIAEEKGKDSRAAQEFLIKLNKETEVLGKQQIELAQTKTKLEEFGKESKDAGKGAGELADKEDQARAATGRLKDTLDGLKTKLSNLGSGFKDLGDKVLKGLAVGIAAIGAALAGVAIGVGKLLSKTIQPASDLSETVSKVGIVFGDQADKVLKFGENAATSIGMSANAALSAAGVYGNLFRSMGMSQDASADMSMGLVQLAGDLASFNNMDPTEVLDKLRAGLTGEAEPLKSLGVNINEALIKERALEMGLWDGKDALDASAKAQASYSLIMEQTSLAQGDFARTSGGLANQQRILAAKMENLKAKIGTALLPLITKITTKFQEWLSDPKIQKGIDELVEGIRTIADTIGRVMDKLLAGDMKGALAEIFPKETVKQIVEFGKALKGVIVNVIIPFIKEHAEGIKAAIIGIGAVLAGAGIVSLIAAIANPLGLIIAAVGLLAAAWAEDWGGIRTTITDWWNTTGKPIFDQLVQWLQVNIPLAIQTLSEFWSGTLQPALATFWSWVEATVFPIIQQLIAWLAVNIPIAIQALSEYWTGTLQPALETFWNWVQTTVFPIIQTLWDWLATNVPLALQTLANFWTNTLRPAIEGVWSWLSTVVFPFFESFGNLLGVIVVKSVDTLVAIWENVLLPTLTTVYNFIKDKLQPVWDALSEFFSKTFGPVLDTFRTGPWKSFMDVLGEVAKIIGGVKDTFDKMAKAIMDFKLPAWATRHSPSPFEMVFLGANEAIKDLQREFPKLAGDLKLSMPDMGNKPQVMQPAPVYVTVNAAVASTMDVYDLAYRVADVINRRR